VFHRLALSAIQRKLGSPVWLTDNRIAAVASSSIDRSTVDLDRGEMAFHLFDFDDRYDAIARSDADVISKLDQLSATFENAVFPGYLKEFILRMASNPQQQVAIHGATSISGYTHKEGVVDKVKIERRQGFIGSNQMEKSRYPNAEHHLKVFHNEETGKGRVFYKFEGSIQFVQNVRS
jgi:hypothetical protein